MHKVWLSLKFYCITGVCSFYTSKNTPNLKSNKTRWQQQNIPHKRHGAPQWSMTSLSVSVNMTHSVHLRYSRRSPPFVNSAVIAQSYFPWGIYKAEHQNTSKWQDSAAISTSRWTAHRIEHLRKQICPDKMCDLQNQFIIETDWLFLRMRVRTTTYREDAATELNPSLLFCMLVRLSDFLLIVPTLPQVMYL